MKTVEITYRYAGDDVTARERPADAEAARRRMDEGNQAFADLFARLDARSGTARRVIRVDRRDLGLLPAGAGSPHQRPYAAVLGCADARVPIELIFNEGPNDLFVVRVAGNTLGDDVRGSLRYALEHLGESLKLVVVLGHSGCGAVTAAVDVFLDPSGYLSLTSKHSIRSLVDRLQVVVQASAKKMHAVFGPDIARHPHYRDALIEAAVVMNAALAAHTLQREIDAEAADGVRTAYGVYLLSERTVWAPRCGGDDVVGLAAPPEDLQGFVTFGDAVLRSERINRLLAR
ncbi:MAG: carbonic anhydrase [Burkholderiaceae bacterium]|nr:carbonic anhydrase [Burkholderiaceae bacterium]